MRICLAKLAIITLIVSGDLFAAHGRTASAVPTQLILTRSEGVMVLGNFGNPAQCPPNEAGSNLDRVWFPRSHAEYDTIYSTRLAAMMAGKKVNFYIHSCISVTWFSGDSVKYNQLTVGDVRILKNSF